MPLASTTSLSAAAWCWRDELMATDARWVPLSEFLQMQDRIYEDHFFIANHFLGGLGLQPHF